MIHEDLGDTIYFVCSKVITFRHEYHPQHNNKRSHRSDNSVRALEGIWTGEEVEHFGLTFQSERTNTNKTVETAEDDTGGTMTRMVVRYAQWPQASPGLS
jgi:hypothetical protein